jgi:hypothetical protein
LEKSSFGLGGGWDMLEVFLCAAALSGVAWHLDIAWRSNHGFWLNKAAMFFFVAFFTQAFVDENAGLACLVGIALILFSIFPRRWAGVSFGL